MRNKQALASLMAVLLGLLLVLVSTQLFEAGSGSLWVMIGIALFAAGASAFFSVLLWSYFARKKPGWDLGNTRDAHLKLESIVPSNATFNDIAIVAYTANSAYRLLEFLERKNCYAKRLRVLLKSPVSLLNGRKDGKPVEGKIPNHQSQMDTRLNQMSAHLSGDLLRKQQGVKRVEKPEIKLYTGDPVLRGIVIDGKMGFFSIYTAHKSHPEIIDYSATGSATLRLSMDGGYEEKLLADFVKWFGLVWEHGSHPPREEDLNLIR